MTKKALDSQIDIFSAGLADDVLGKGGKRVVGLAGKREGKLTLLD